MYSAATRRSRSRTLSAPVRGKRPRSEGLPIREHVGEPQRAEGISGNRHLPGVAGVQDREHGKLPTGWRRRADSSGGETRSETPRPEGVAVWA